MNTTILREAGYHEAILGLSLSYGSKWSPNDELKAYEVASRLAFKGDGHNKFLESMCVWLDVTAPRFFWAEMDTYRVGMTKQSESTMHTLKLCNRVTSEMFEYPLEDHVLDDLTTYSWMLSNGTISIDRMKSELPEGFLQRRILCTNYATLQRIIRQRMKHRLPQWRQFCTEVLSQVKFPEFLYKADGKDTEVGCA